MVYSVTHISQLVKRFCPEYYGKVYCIGYQDGTWEKKGRSSKVNWNIDEGFMCNVKDNIN